MENKISISGIMMQQMNFALQQNYIPVFKNLVLKNLTAEEMENVTLRMSFEPAFAKPYEVMIAKLLPDKEYEIKPVKIVISPEFLFSMTEKTVSNITIEIFSEDGLLAIENRNIDVLAYDQWTGTGYMPHMISAFVMPNHPAVKELISSAGTFMLKWTENPAFLAYETQNPNNVKMQMAAIYAALQQKNIAYSLPPASFEGAQRVRLPDEVLNGRNGTCLDLTVLYASALESVGLNPIIIFTEGHAFAGCRLENETFPDSVVYDVSAVSKRTAQGIDNICLVECTDFVAGKNVDFDKSFENAKEHLNDTDKFLFAIDVAACRAGGIRPMPSRINENGVFKAADYGERKKSELTSAPSEIDMSVHGMTAAEKGELTKQAVWERKLLDLSLRNSLLNFRPRNSNVQLMLTDLAGFEDSFSMGKDYKVMPAPAELVTEISDSKIYEIDKDTMESLSLSELESHRLRTFINETDLEKTMKKLHRDAKVSLEENGCNTLYIALGFLRWYETEKSEKPRYAPVVLVPCDVVRKVQDKSYTVRIRDEEVLMNITLLEMLRQNFGIDITGLSPLPEDENGINIPLVFNTVRRGVMSKSGWDIVENAFIGQFSFSRFIMWNDIKNRSDDLKKNKVVSSLIGGKMNWEPLDLPLSPKELDRDLKPSDMAVPSSVDSSQLAAVCLASKGESFVLHGPPGTGKSQTITNMIANALYQGKSVLFIAEKMAALSVVQKRLSKMGLAPFCLELHSNKAQKRAVLKQLESTLEIGRIKEPESYADKAEKLSKLRAELNATMDSIHKKRNYGMSVYDAIVLYEKYAEYKGLVTFTSQQITEMQETTYSQWYDAVDRALTSMRECGKYEENPFRFSENREYTIEIREKLLSELGKTVTDLQTAYDDSTTLSAMLGFKVDDYKCYLSANDLLTVFSRSGKVLVALACDDGYDIKLMALQKLTDSGKARNELKASLLSAYDEKVLSYDADTASLAWKAAEQKWFIPKSMEQGKLLKELNLYAKTPFTKENITAEYEKLCNFKKLTEEINGANAELTSLLGGMWIGCDSDYGAIEKALADSKKLRQAIINLQLTPAQKTAVVQSLGGLVLNEKQTAIIGRSEVIKADIDTLKNEYKISTEQLMWGENWTSDSVKYLKDMINDIGSYKAWTNLLITLDKLREAGLANVAQSYINGKINSGNALPAFICGVSGAMSMLTVSSDDNLTSFTGVQLDDTVKRYSEAIAEFERLTVNELVAKLSAKIPAVSSSSVGSELGILQKAIKSGGRMMPIRKLFDSIPNLLRRMCPCMLMSPISVAQYIDPAYPKFDLVIFDEASQLPTCEAVGAIARGENVVVVGDPKQLPPTSFFNANSIDEENYEKEDLESVLDDCLALSMPQKHLLWHYRSRHESLIAYSNAKYYENKLMTFPSPSDLKSEVSWVKVEGYYDKGGSKQNKAEAEAVVKEIARRLSDEKLRQNSIGVVTFSLVQQVLIDDLLQEEYRRNPQLETWANEMYEPIFIKNLENVQGDERDVILFSVGYGPDKDGKVSMNFGPLNRDGGWRRLNVAISRSRKQMMVFSVITPDMIDLSRTNSEGVEGLKGFLEFAAKGKNVLMRNVSADDDIFGIEDIVADELKKAGYEVKTNIGCSGYKIDIGIVNPDSPETYMLGIMVDSKKHLDSSTARDRNVSQPSVLKGLGWNIMNVYTLDWLDNKQQVTDKIKETADKILSDIRSGKTEEVEEVKKAEPVTFEKEEVKSAAEMCDEYVPFKEYKAGTPEDFKEGSGKVRKAVEDVLKAEAPVSKNVLYKKTLSCFGITRGTSTVKKAFEQACAELGVCTTNSKGNDFCWQSPEQVINYNVCRITKDGGEKRPMDEIAPEEIAAGVKIILTDQISMSRDNLIKETAKLFGYTRLGDVIENSTDTGISCAVAKGYVTVDDAGKVTLSEQK